MTKDEEMKRQGESGLEGKHAISAAEMSEEPDNNTVPDEFLREEIGCCPEKVNDSLEKRDLSAEPALRKVEVVGMTNDP